MYGGNIMGFLGMRGTGDWAVDQRPKNWREAILYEYPNGSAPLTAIMSKMKGSSLDDPEFNWWTKSLPTQSGAITNIYTNALMTSAYTSGGLAGDRLYVKVAEATAAQIRSGHQVLLRDASDYDVDVNAKVTGVQKNGASSCITVKLLEADTATANSHDLSDADRILVIGNINPEGASMPDPISYDPTKISNYAQIFRTSLEITRTARLTKLRTGDAYKEAKREALELHSIEMEKAWLWGIKSENTGDNGKLERTTRGLINIIKTYASNNVDDFTLNTDYSGDTWLASGEEWLDNMLRLMFRYGKSEKLILAGDGALLGINRLAKSSGQMTLTSETKSYGIQVNTWQTPFGTVHIKTHPLFSYEAANQHSMVIFEPEGLKYRHITDTKFYPDTGNNGWTRKDGTAEEFLTEAGLEFHFPTGWGYLNGVGKDNIV
jgi:hypothetical protein